MYATNAFALKQVIRKILVEAFFDYQVEKGRLHESLDIQTIDGENLSDFHQWAAELEHQFNRLKDTQADVRNQIQIRHTIVGSDEVFESGNKNR